MGEPAMSVRGLRKSFGAKEAVAGINAGPMMYARRAMMVRRFGPYGG